MSMIEVERLLGKPDRVETEQGGITETEEKVIRWYYQRFPVLASGKDYGATGYLNFVPVRFFRMDADSASSDSIARQYGEQSDAYQTFSYVGSFRWRRSSNDAFAGELGGIPIKQIRNQIPK
jgi:hypothetical protein